MYLRYITGLFPSDFCLDDFRLMAATAVFQMETPLINCNERARDHTLFHIKIKHTIIHQKHLFFIPRRHVSCSINLEVIPLSYTKVILGSNHASADRQLLVSA